MDDWDVSCAFSEFKLTRLKSVSVSRQSLFSRLWHGGQWYYHLIGQDRNIPPLERETPLGLIARYYPEGKKLGTFKTHLPSESFFLNLILKYDYARYFRSIRVGATGLSTEISVNELVSNFVTVLLYVFYLSLICHLTRSDSTDCKRIPREENTYCNRLHYQKLSCSCTFSASEESQITIRPCKPLYFSVLNYTLRVLVAGVYYLVIIVKDSSIIKINFMGKIFYFEMNFLSI